MPAAIKRIRRLVGVRGPTKINVGSSTECDKFEETKIPETLKDVEINADLVLVIRGDYTDEGFHAYAVPCFQDPVSNRVLLGVLTFNFKQMFFGRENIEKNTGLIIHEVFHILAYSTDLYDFWSKTDLNSSTLNDILQQFNLQHWIVNSKLAASDYGFQRVDEFYFFRSPLLYQFAQNYFDCSSLLGIPMENEGDNGNKYVHFDKSFFMEELMTP